MSSNCDSEGFPVDHDGQRLEDGVFDSGAPFAVRSDILREILSGSGKEVAATHLEVDPLAPTGIKPSSLGGIPILERVDIEDVVDGYSSSDSQSPRGVKAPGKNQMSSTVHAMMHTMKTEREELYSTRKKLMDALKFLKTKGYSETDILKSLKDDGFGASMLDRDDFGMPRSGVSVGKAQQNPDAHQVNGEMPLKKSPNPFVDKMKSKVDVTQVIPPKEDLGPVMNDKPDDVTISKTTDAKPKSWAEMLAKPPSPEVSFDYFPRKAGSDVVSPPLEVLQKGNEKLKLCITGSFSKGFLPFKKVSDFAFSTWKKFGLQHISQKDERTFIFRFSDVGGITSVLSTGTWYVEKRPLLVYAWGTTPGSISHMPLWVRFDRVPDSYWTREGLSCLGSAIGKPLTADDLTKKLEILPFAKLCVDYNIGDALPTKLNVEVLEPNSDKVVLHEVLVSYPHMPVVCNGCRSLGHLIGACPKTVRKWVEKKRPAPEPDSTVIPPVADNSGQPCSSLHNDKIPPSSNVSATVTPGPATEEWHTVSRKHKPPVFESPTSDSTPPRNSFKNLTMVDEIDAKFVANLDQKLSKSQRKKQKRVAKGMGASPSPPL